MIYTSPGFFDRQLPLTNWAWRQPLWIAHWTKAEQPRLPNVWRNHKKSWTFWQHSADKNGLGHLYGVATKSMNLNRFNGSAAQFMKRYKLTSLPKPVEPPPPVAEEQLAPKYQVTVRALHVRAGPGVNYPIVRDLRAGDVIQVLGVSAPEEAWVQIGEDQWCAFAFNSNHFLKKITPNLAIS